MHTFTSLSTPSPPHNTNIHTYLVLLRYRYYKDTPLFPFGFGLSFTAFHFALENMENALSTADGGRCVRGGHSDAVHRTQACDAREFAVRVSNIGQRRGTETVQLYMIPPKGVQWDAPVPRKRLLGFRKVSTHMHTRAHTRARAHTHIYSLTLSLTRMHARTRTHTHACAMTHSIIHSLNSPARLLR